MLICNVLRDLKKMLTQDELIEKINSGTFSPVLNIETNELLELNLYAFTKC